MIQILKYLRRLFSTDESTLHCPRCHTPLPDTPCDNSLYCEACHTSYEVTLDIHYEEPTKGVTYRLTGKSYYGKR